MGGYAYSLQKGRGPVVFIVTSSKKRKTGTLGVGGTGLGWFRAQVALESAPAPVPVLLSLAGTTGVLLHPSALGSHLCPKETVPTAQVPSRDCMK